MIKVNIKIHHCLHILDNHLKSRTATSFLAKLVEDAVKKKQLLNLSC